MSCFCFMMMISSCFLSRPQKQTFETLSLSHGRRSQRTLGIRSFVQKSIDDEDDDEDYEEDYDDEDNDENDDEDDNE